MRKLIYQTWISLDGFAADADNSTKFFEDRKFAADSDDDLLASMENIDTILMGANTYKLFVGFWPTPDSNQEIMSEMINSTPKIVFSRSLQEAPWGAYAPVQIESNDAVAAVKELKTQSGKDMVLWGSLSLANAFMKEKLIDEYHIRVVPLVLGQGTPLFQNKESLSLNLVDSSAYSSGLVLLQYTP